jgi:hypothetical protein
MRGDILDPMARGCTLSLVATLFGCADGPACYEARSVRLTEVVTADGEVVFRNEASELRYPLIAQGASEPLAQNRCWARLREDYVYQDARHDLSPSDDLVSAVEFQCANAEPLFFRDFHAIAYVQDLRLLGANGSPSNHGVQCLSCLNLGETYCAHYAEPVVMVQLLDSAGTAAAYPAMVTDDFRRLVRIEVRMGRVGTSDAGPACTENIEVTATATLTVTPDRYRAAGITHVCAE